MPSAAQITLRGAEPPRCAPRRPSRRRRAPAPRPWPRRTFGVTEGTATAVRTALVTVLAPSASLVDDQVAAEHGQSGVGALVAGVDRAVDVPYDVLDDQLLLGAEAYRVGGVRGRGLLLLDEGGAGRGGQQHGGAAQGRRAGEAGAEPAVAVPVASPVVSRALKPRPRWRRPGRYGDARRGESLEAPRGVSGGADGGGRPGGAPSEGRVTSATRTCQEGGMTLAENRRPDQHCVRVNPRDLGKEATCGAYGVGKKRRRPGRR